ELEARLVLSLPPVTPKASGGAPIDRPSRASSVGNDARESGRREPRLNPAEHVHCQHASPSDPEKGLASATCSADPNLRSTFWRRKRPQTPETDRRAASGKGRCDSNSQLRSYVLSFASIATERPYAMPTRRPLWCRKRWQKVD